ncbi:TIGR00725 family protein [Desulfurella sp.]|uniref:TIGR00725 family protein n=1 Tax=Desulfurella sp. TaxID=1962857 RepID=UPI0025BB3C52|nr:TIGR00725 family protein [Desulfurella sp.]
MYLIGVIGSQKATEQAKNIAYEVGKLIALNNFVLVCGGLDGVMEAASKGAFEHGGLTVGILPDKDKKNANPYIKIPIASGMGYARNFCIVQSADCLIAIEGSYGTLNEISAALNLQKTVIGIECSWNIEGMKFANSPQEAIELAKKFIFS